jgi:hypothetical protein
LLRKTFNRLQGYMPGEVHHRLFYAAALLTGHRSSVDIQYALHCLPLSACTALAA